MKSSLLKGMIVAAAVLAFSAAAVVGQTAAYRFQDVLCEYEGTYNTKKYTARQIDDTRKLLFSDDLRLSTFRATVWEYKDIAAIDITAFDNEYKAVKARIEALEVIKTPFITAFKNERLRELEQVYKLGRTTMQAYTEPAVLSQFSFAEKCVKEYAGPIAAGGESLVAAWRKVNLASQAKNGNPTRLQQRFDEQNASPDRLKFALVETMAFGWWNCANAEIAYARTDNSEQMIKEFAKLFVKFRTVSCDEP